MYLVEFIGVSEERSASIFRVKEKMLTVLHTLTLQKNVILLATAVRISELITLFCIGFYINCVCVFLRKQLLLSCRKRMTIFLKFFGQNPTRPLLVAVGI
jgi:hypothetical protein